MEQSRAETVETSDSLTGDGGRWAALLLREFTVSGAALVIAVSFGVSAVLGAVRQVLLNARFGAGAEVSAYYAAARLPETLFTLIAGGALWTAMIPTLSDVRRTGGDGAVRRLADTVLGAVLAVAVLLVATGMLAAPWFVSTLLAPGFDAGERALTTRLTRLLLIQPLLLTVGSVAMAVLNARSRFLLPAVAIAVHNLAEIAGIAAVWLVPSLGIYGPVCGAVGGAVLQGGVLFAFLWRSEWRPRPRWAPGDAALRATLRLLVPTSLSLGVGYLGGVLDASFASRSPEAGALPAIVNAWLLAGLPVRIIGFAAAQAAFPRLVLAANGRDTLAFRRLTVRTTAAIAALSIPAALGLVLLARPVVRLLFEHGAFDAKAGSLTSRQIVIYALGLPFFAVTEILTRGLTALRDTRTPLLTNLAQLTLRGAICALLLDRFGVAIIPAAFVLSSIVETVILGAALGRRAAGTAP